MNLTQFFESSNFVSGLFELDGSGTVLYSRFKSRGQLTDLIDHLTGQNFFEDFMKFENANDFRRKFKSFVASRQFTDSFNFECRLTEKTVPVRVMMLRATEMSEIESRSILIVDIRKNIA